MKSRLYSHYDNKISKSLVEEFGYSNKMLIPKIQKIVLHSTSSDFIGDIKSLNAFAKDLTLISGQKVMMLKAKKSVASFKLRKGQDISCKVTLRRDKMYDFLDRLINISLPRVRDFLGFSSSSFDLHGNFNFGLKDHSVFVEVDYDKIEKIHGLDISIITNASTKEESLFLLKAFNFPFRN